MREEISVWLLVYTALAALVLVVAHAATCRLQGARAGSPQVKLVRLILGLNVLLLVGVCILAVAEGRLIGEAMPMLLFFFIVYNGFAYAYFQFLNMSETARRIRMLIEIWQHGGEMALGELMGAYTPGTMVRARLERLVQWGQVVQDVNGLYRVDGKFLLTASYLMEWFKRTLNIHRRSTYD